jgi:hypothetical protein
MEATMKIADNNAARKVNHFAYAIPLTREQRLRKLMDNIQFEKDQLFLEQFRAEDLKRITALMLPQH